MGLLQSWHRRLHLQCGLLHCMLSRLKCPCSRAVPFLASDSIPAHAWAPAAMLTLTLRRRLEPAGSHGVWGLDDYQFMPFLWGAAQLMSHPTLRPECVLNDSILQQQAPEYLYLAAVHFVRQVSCQGRHPVDDTDDWMT